MHILYYLIFAHFFADYCLQPNWLAQWKKRSFWGILVHVLFIGFTMLVVLIPYLHYPRVWLAIGVISLAHIVLDTAKIHLEKRYRKLDDRLMYLLDQLLHLLIISVAAVYLAGPVLPGSLASPLADWYSNRSLVIYLTALVLTTYVWDISRYIFRQTTGAAYERDYAGMFFRAFIVSVIAVFVVIGMR